MQNQEVKIDLRVSRRESGLLQGDLAHLLGTTQPRISRLEQGRSVLTIKEAVKLTIVFGKSPTVLFRLLSAAARTELSKQIATMSGDPVNVPNAEARQRTLSQLEHQLSGERRTADGNAT